MHVLNVFDVAVVDNMIASTVPRVRSTVQSKGKELLELLEWQYPISMN